MLTIERTLELAARHFVVTGLTILAALGLLAMAILPDSPAAKEREIRDDLSEGKVAMIAKSPDGATVWAVQREGRTIYFSKGAMVIEPAPQPPS